MYSRRFETGFKMVQCGVGLVLLLLAALGHTKSTAPSFTIDYTNNSFVKDGHPVQLAAGTVQYFRVHPTDWVDRLRKLRYAGFNAVQTSIEWMSHEPEPGHYDFSGINNITDFIQKAAEQDLMVVLRPGPYTDAERDMGGLPYWLLREDPTMKLRTMDPSFMHFVDIWLGNVLLPMLKPLMYSEGGPVVMIQVETEYGGYPACDFKYTSKLRDLYREKLGSKVLLFSTDLSDERQLMCGKIPEVYETVEFGPGFDPTVEFGYQRLFEPSGPLMDNEYYPGWQDYWGVVHYPLTPEFVTYGLDKLMSMNASFNMYVLSGGTSFGLTTGSWIGDRFMSVITSYDFGAPVSEAGDLTDKYYAVRNVIGKYLPLPTTMTPPVNSSKFAYGSVTLSPMAHLFDVALTLPSVQSVDPLTFEALSVFNGVVVYETIVQKFKSDPALLKFESVNDRGYVFLNGRLVGLLSREHWNFEVPVLAKEGDRLSVVVESQGRIHYGGNITDTKGIIGEVTLGDTLVKNWTNTAIPLTNITWLEPPLYKLINTVTSQTTMNGEFVFYNGTLKVPNDPRHPMDTFLKLDGWNKGIAWINDFCLGRYWPIVGPQQTLYVPRGVLKKGDNRVVVLELEGAPCVSPSYKDCTVSFTKVHIIDGPATNAKLPSRDAQKRQQTPLNRNVHQRLSGPLAIAFMEQFIS